MAADTHLLVSQHDTCDPVVDTNTAFPRTRETCITLAIKAAVTQEDDVGGYLRHIYNVFKLSSLAAVIRTLFTLAGLAVFIIGLIRFQNCVFEPEIPLFLVLEGAVIILKTCIFVMRSCHTRYTAEGERNTLDTCTDIASLFLVLWTLTGSVWIFGAYSNSHLNLDDEDDPIYCDKLVYMCSLWFLVAIYCFSIVFIMLILVLIIYYLVKTDGVKKQLPYDICV